jgi:hypothetical protein
MHTIITTRSQAKPSTAMLAVMVGVVLAVTCLTPLACGPSAAEDCFGRECDAGGDSDTDVDSDSDTDSDSDSDADTDSDTDTSTDTDSTTDAPEHVDCEAEPLTCLDIGETEEQQYFGCCFEGTVYFCSSGILGSIDCEGQGYACGYSDAFEVMDCV